MIEAEAGSFARWGLGVGDVLEVEGGDRGGRLVLVGTPIGNLGDLSPRAVEVLAEADVVVCEDTRRTGRLLQARRRVGPRCSPPTTTTKPRRSARCSTGCGPASPWRW